MRSGARGVAGKESAEFVDGEGAVPTEDGYGADADGGVVAVAGAARGGAGSSGACHSGGLSSGALTPRLVAADVVVPSHAVHTFDITPWGSDAPASLQPTPSTCATARAVHWMLGAGGGDADMSGASATRPPRVRRRPPACLWRQCPRPAMASQLLRFSGTCMAKSMCERGLVEAAPFRCLRLHGDCDIAVGLLGRAARLQLATARHRGGRPGGGLPRRTTYARCTCWLSNVW